MLSLLNEVILNNEINRLVLIDINAIFNIDEKSDMDISDNELDNTLDRIIDATDSVGEGTESQNIQLLLDSLVTKNDIYTIMYNTMKLYAYFDNDELNSLIKWEEKLNCVGGCCLLNHSNNDREFMFAFQTEMQKELIKFARVIVCLRRVTRDMMNTNNLIEAFYRKLKYVYMRRRSRRCLDSEVYLLVEIVLWDLNFSVFLDDLNIR
ncbi:2025_t:CDS:2, partial [Scutellospora calospora]